MKLSWGQNVEMYSVVPPVHLEIDSRSSVGHSAVPSWPDGIDGGAFQSVPENGHIHVQICQRLSNVKFAFHSDAPRYWWRSC